MRKFGSITQAQALFFKVEGGGGGQPEEKIEIGFLKNKSQKQIKKKNSPIFKIQIWGEIRVSTKLPQYSFLTNLNFLTSGVGVGRWVRSSFAK